MFKPFTDHPASVNETYGEHFVHASSFGLRMIGGGVACLLHGVFPFLFEKTGSKQICVLHDRMVTNRIKQSDQSLTETCQDRVQA